MVERMAADSGVREAPGGESDYEGGGSDGGSDVVAGIVKAEQRDLMAMTRLCIDTGFPSKASAPAARNPRASSERALADTPTTGRWRSGCSASVLSRFLRMRTNQYPDRAGMTASAVTAVKEGT